MASACVNQISSPGWFSPRISFSQDIVQEEPIKYGEAQDSNDANSFEFRLDDPVKKMLPADQLFLNGKLIPVQNLSHREDVLLDDGKDFEEQGEEIIISDIMISSPSPKAPKCAYRWKELLGLRKSQTPIIEKEKEKPSSLHCSSKSAKKSLNFFLHKNPKSSSSYMNLVKDLDSEIEEMVSFSSRMSLSSSSSSEEQLNLPLPRIKLRGKTRATRPSASGRTGRSVARNAAPPDSETSSRGASLDSPRMNSSGKIVFHGLERSSSSPSSFNGGPRMKARGMERSYSGNVRIRPVLNVLICSSLRGSSSKSAGVSSGFGFGHLFSSSAGGSRNQTIKKKISNPSK